MNLLEVQGGRSVAKAKFELVANSKTVGSSLGPEVTAYSLRTTFSQLAMAIEATSARTDGCGRRASGHAAAATPSGVMNSRRFIQGDTANVLMRYPDGTHPRWKPVRV